MEHTMLWDKDTRPFDFAQGRLCAGTSCTDLPSEIPATPISRDEHGFFKPQIAQTEDRGQRTEDGRQETEDGKSSVERFAWPVARRSWIVTLIWINTKYEARNPKQIQNLNDQTLKLATEVTEGSENSIIFNRRERKRRKVYKYMHIYLWSTLCFETKIPAHSTSLRAGSARAQVARIYPVR